MFRYYFFNVLGIIASTLIFFWGGYTSLVFSANLSLQVCVLMRCSVISSFFVLFEIGVYLFSG